MTFQSLLIQQLALKKSWQTIRIEPNLHVIWKKMKNIINVLKNPRKFNKPIAPIRGDQNHIIHRRVCLIGQIVI